MLDKNFLTSFLRLNNASEQLTDDDVRATLARAGWTSSESEAAIALLRRGSGNLDLPNQGSATAFRPDMEFSSTQLSNFLGVDIQIDPHRLGQGSYSYHAAGSTYSVRQVVLRALYGTLIFSLSLGIAGAMGFSFLYFLEIGPFRT